MKTSDFYYDLPKELIAQTPLKDRSSSKLMKVNVRNRNIKHDIFNNIIDYLNEGDCLVLNNTKVIPARLIGRRSDTQGKIEILMLHRLIEASSKENRLNPLVEELSTNGKNIWVCLVKPGKKAKLGSEIIFGDGILKATVIDITEDGSRVISFQHKGIFEEVLDKLGTMPLPPYITEKLNEQDRYQTVYAKYEGSAAAPTAGLHFTDDLLASIQKKGVKIAYITLHVGIGTFRPVKVDNVNEHKMHSEYYYISEEAKNLINSTKAAGHRVIAVGTTSCRTLEAAAEANHLEILEGDTDIFIFPGYKFKIVDALITNFHLPESTLLMLVSALADKALIMDAYSEAIKNNYRFFSFGDAMFIE